MGSWSREFDSLIIATLAEDILLETMSANLILENLGVFNTLTIDTDMPGTGTGTLPFNAIGFSVLLYIGGQDGTLIREYTLWGQSVWWAPSLNGGFRNGDATHSIIPLHGADTVRIALFTNSLITLTNVTGTSESQTFSHSTSIQRGFRDPGQSGNGGQELLYQSAYTYSSTDSLLQIPLPVADTPSRFYLLLEPSSTASNQGFSIYGSILFGGNTNGPLYIRDNIMSKNVNIGVEKVYNGTGLTDQTNAAVHWISLPHTLTPMYINFDKPSSGNAILDFALITDPGFTSG